MNQIPAGWYNDPSGSGQSRYWDGTAWTTQLRDPAPPDLPPDVRRPLRFELDTQSRAQPLGKHHARNRGARTALLSAIALVVFGLAGLIVAPPLFEQFVDERKPAVGSVATTGVVVDLDVSTRNKACTPVVEFTVNSETYRVSSPIGQGPCPFSIGQPVGLTYLPSSPESSARLDSDIETFGMVRVFIYAFGGLLILMGLVELTRAVRHRWQQQEV